MKLRSLRLHGFKSFADRTQLEFRDGISAVVGSNGCGKSNLADAIRWVLGEQRASVIRGAKMEEVIFEGTKRRRPLNFAEVGLLFSNEQGRVAIPHSEIEIARRTFREGGSEYSLNRSACRLRDVHGLLRDTGLGANAYAIIEAAMIETLLSDRAEERRGLFEEAAGIGRYKDSRQSTMRRLEAAEVDLARLGDLVAEVESKVRSLARQRRKAQRLKELQARRLDLEVAIACRELQQLEDSLQQSRSRVAELEQDASTAAATRRAGDERMELARGQLAACAQQRARLNAQLEEVRNRLHSHERDALLADERRSNAELRLEQLARERVEQEVRRRTQHEEANELAASRTREAEALAIARAALERIGAEADVLRSSLAGERQRSESLSAQQRELARTLAVAEGDRAACEARLREAEQRIEQLSRQRDELTGEIDRLGTQTDLWAGQSAQLREHFDEAAAAAERWREEVDGLRRRGDELRQRLHAAEAMLARLGAQIAAREAVEQSYEGFSPAVAAIMAQRTRFPGVFGPLADHLDSEPAEAADLRTVETFLGPLLHALVVRDLGTARLVRRWFREEWTGGGTLLMMPLDAPALSAPAGSGAEAGGEATGAGAAWSRALLGGLLALAEGDALAEYTPGRGRTAPLEVLEASGLIRLLSDGDAEGILVRREQLTALHGEHAASLVTREEVAAENEELLLRLEAAQERSRQAEESCSALTTELRRVDAEAIAHVHRQDRLQHDRDEVCRALNAQESIAGEAAQRGAELELRLGELSAALQESAGAAELAQRRLGELEARWETARDAHAEQRIGVARAEGALNETDRRLNAARQATAAAGARLQAIDVEAAELRVLLESLFDVRSRASDEMEALFGERDACTHEFARIDAQAAAAEAEVASLTQSVRAARQREADCAEERHRLDLQAAEARASHERIRERLEAEWGRPWEALLAAANPVEPAELADWRAGVRETATEIEALGPVNMLAVEEHEEESRRLEFLLSQQKDLIVSRDDLVAAIRQINRTAREVFVATFSQIRENFQRTFHSLFHGGECDVWLADPDDPLESPVEIQASPRGKRTQRIHLLSGGERTLTALALLFAIYLVKPAPFCVLDEVDAPLDDSNVDRFIQLLQDFKADTQFIVITHNTRTMEAADWVYGVTMEEPGVSSIVGVELEGAWNREGRVA
jgi:chromosome segregation protein